MKEHWKKIFLSGICGTAMASLAGMLKTAGYQVSGSDQTVYPPMSDFLRELEIPIAEGFSERNIQTFRPDLVVIGNALSRGNPEVEYVLDRDIRYASMPETLRELFIRGRQSIVVAGTHGKTTTSAMLAWMLESTGRKPSFLIGGIAENFQSSFQLASGREFVVEGDEYDTAFFDKGPKFLHYLPKIALVKNIEFDHADIYQNLDEIQTSFRRLMNIVPRAGLIIAGTDSPAVKDLLSSVPAPVATFGLNSGDWTATEVVPEGAGMRFDVVRTGEPWHRFWLPLVGQFNVLNALGAIIAGDKIGLTASQMATALRSFKNVRRRLENRGEVRGVTVYDDFAHHPTAVGATLRGMRSQFEKSRIWAVFEPRSQTSRRRIFEAELADSLRLADIAVIAPVYSPGHIDPSNTLSPDRVAERIKDQGGKAHALDSTSEIVDYVSTHARSGDRVVVMSNGGFDHIHERLLAALKR